MRTQIKAEPLVTGHASGPAMILSEPLSLWGGLDASTGEIIDRRHPNSGQNVAGQVLLMSAGRGSSSASSVLLEAVRAETAPAAIILQERDGILSLGAVVSQVLYEKGPPVIILSGQAYAQIQEGSQIQVDCEEQEAWISILP